MELNSLDWAGFKLRDLPASPSQVLGSKLCPTTPDPSAEAGILVEWLHGALRILEVLLCCVHKETVLLLDNRTAQVLLWAGGYEEVC